MRAKITLAIALLSCSSMGLGLIACSSDAKPDGGGVDGSVDTGDMSDTGVTDTGADTGKGDSGPDCTKAPDGGNGCRACCQMENPNGALFFQSAIHICVCADASTCPSCANNYCAQNPMLPNQPCGQCAYNTLNADGGVCFGPVGQACGGNKDCAAWFQCQAKCPP